MFDYQFIDQGEKTRVIFLGNIDIESTELIEEEIKPLLHRYCSVELDLSGVAFVDSTGIGLLINLVQDLKENKVSVIFTHINHLVNEVFRLFRLSEILGKDVFIHTGN